MTNSTPVALSCPAKVNLALSVGSPDERGMHPIASWMAAVSFADELTLRAAADNDSSFDIAFANDDAADAGEVTAGLPRDVDWPLEKDLTYRAHALLEAHVGRRLPVDLTLRKHVPAGAGMGGGSSDAAATLVGLNRLFNLGLDTNTLIDLSRQLGSDVAFAVGAATGQASAIVTGLGDRLEPAPRRGVIHLVLILPGFGCDTGAVYRAFDAMHGYTKPPTGTAPGKPPDEAAVRALSRRETPGQAGPFNDLAEPAFRAFPQLRAAHERLTAALALPVHVTGSGATLFVIAPSALTAKALARKVTAVTGFRAIAARTI